MLNKELPSRWYEALTLCQQQGRAHVLATIVAVNGSAPRELQAKMVITEDACSDTLGGGGLEFDVIAYARQLINGEFPSAEPEDDKTTDTQIAKSGKSGKPKVGRRSAVLTKHYPLGAKLGQCCGGSVTVMFECFYQTPVLSLLVFGAGHVAQAMMTICAQLSCQVDWVDSRADIFAQSSTKLPAHIRSHVSDDPTEFIATHAQGRYVIIMTHDHALDFELVRHALDFGNNDANTDVNTDFKKFAIPYIGCIGSKTKAARFQARLRQRGYDEQTINRLIMPIGLDIGGKQPMAVAVSIMAQVLAVYNQS